ncbi:acyclic terpene utilization AtuA family protein [Paractinoplanes globisporus]|uniref:Acyclic terpene utilization AtuA family protein n=1 Tax=Paractinoplanes globisporus TaxID=113565 RepID=A0ABW6W5J7_9ACTN|nr:acyclic terpene utilization AtuA family protein [Actinoplanes globisporus]
MIRIGNFSGFYGDRLSAMREMLEGGDLDVLTGDYLAELTMLILARDRKEDPGIGYALTFLSQLRDCLRLALDRKVRIVTNAGGVNPAALVAAIRQVAADQGLSPTVALVRGDSLGPDSHAYLGAFGIARAMSADIVVTGRVTDASLVIGPAIARYGWDREAFDQLAGATVAGHVIECGTQATGGNYPFFTEIPDMLHPGFPIAEVFEDGSSVITKHPGTGGAVTVGTVTAQLVYEVQDARYAGPDVTTRLDTISLRPDGPDRVSISGVRGEPPPPDVKVSQTRVGGYRNEMTVVLTGLDIEAKADLFRHQFEAALRVRPQELDWTLARVDVPDAATEQQASALLTVVARDPSRRNADRAFSNAAVQVALGSYPGFFATSPPGSAHPYGVFTAGFVPQDAPVHEVVHDDGTVEPVEPPRVCRALEPAAGEHRAEEHGAGEHGAGEHGAGEATRRLPLGTIAGARSGDKGGDANIGVWVRDAGAYPWLENLISEERVRELLPETAALPLRITRLPNIHAINIVVEGLLGEGVAYHARFDPQAKGLGEWLRSRHVDIPVSLLSPEEAP